MQLLSEMFMLYEVHTVRALQLQLTTWNTILGIERKKKIVTYKLTHLLPLLVLKCRARGHKERSQTHGNRFTDWCRVLGNYRGKAWHSHLMFASYLQVQSGAQRNVWLQSCLLLIVLFLDSWGFILAGPQQLSFSPPVYSLYNFSLTYLFHNNHYMFC